MRSWRIERRDHPSRPFPPADAGRGWVRRHEGHVVGGAVRVVSTEKPILTSPSPGPPRRDTAKEAAMSQAQESEVLEPEGFTDSDVSADPQPYYRRAQAEGAVVPGT